MHFNDWYGRKKVAIIKERRESSRSAVQFSRSRLTISERPKRVRCDGTAMDVGGTRRGGFSLVTNRTCTCLEASDTLPVGSMSSLTLFSSLSLRLAWEEVKLSGGGKRQSSERRRKRFKLGLGFWEGMRWFSIGPFFLNKVWNARSIRWNKYQVTKLLGLSLQMIIIGPPILIPPSDWNYGLNYSEY